jgi:hypothetical protein
MPSRPLAAALVALFAVLAPGAAQAQEGFRNLTADQAQTLVSLARDFLRDEDTPAERYRACLVPLDGRVGDPQHKERMDEALKVVEGAVRRMGYSRYPDITDDYERRRLGKMLGEGAWMREFRAEMSKCLEEPAGSQAGR